MIAKDPILEIRHAEHRITPMPLRTARGATFGTTLAVAQRVNAPLARIESRIDWQSAASFEPFVARDGPAQGP